ncbi:precorrin-6y C5,15-methyltransferase (decarboxylating) subunit CbiE [Actinokineospora sp. NBRC 105648]|uniref:precorrin-6y C5,15-methyltransferase (decarboxylating) subunit CbiE n=1 Tax=Actinokineospora sp. NBRC 105648 TaxID=3032206 RepID=UPI0024A5F3F8|nr:hypothetical protein Acsp05_38440 [Actinokineospora sp. NBRC 105648]
MVTVVGIGADGWAGLGSAQRALLAAAEVVVGSARQLDLLPASVGAERVEWPSPLVPAIPGLLAAHEGRALCVLASGDPMFYGIGTTLSRFTEVRVLPHPSSVSLACARLGWAVESVEVVSAVARPLDRLHAVLHHGRRVLVLSENSGTPTAVEALLRERGFEHSTLTVLNDLGDPAERISTAADAGDLNVVAIECVGPRGLPRVPGLPDDAYEHDGQITKREIRAITLAALAPAPGLLLWDVGAGSGSIGIEWSRTHPSCRTVAVEPRADRADRVERNAARLGVPGLRVVRDAAPAALADLDTPDSIFIGGGVTADGVLPACWAALPPGGRIVVNAVTVESESLITQWHRQVGGDLVRLSVSRAAPVGGFTGWRPMMPVTQWSATKPTTTPTTGPTAGSTGAAAGQPVSPPALVSPAGPAAGPTADSTGAAAGQPVSTPALERPTGAAAEPRAGSAGAAAVQPVSRSVLVSPIGPAAGSCAGSTGMAVGHLTLEPPTGPSAGLRAGSTGAAAVQPVSTPALEPPTGPSPRAGRWPAARSRGVAGARSASPPTTASSGESAADPAIDPLTQERA